MLTLERGFVRQIHPWKNTGNFTRGVEIYEIYLNHNNQVAAKEGVVRLRAGQDYTLRWATKATKAKPLLYNVDSEEKCTCFPCQKEKIQFPIFGYFLVFSFSSFDFRCSAHGQPNPRIMWTKTVSNQFTNMFIHKKITNSKIYLIERNFFEVKYFHFLICYQFKQSWNVLVGIQF